MFVLISDFWETFLASNFAINFLISSVLVSRNLKVLDCFLVWVVLIFLIMILETGSFSDESKLSFSWFLSIFLIGILMKYLFRYSKNSYQPALSNLRIDANNFIWWKNRLIKKYPISKHDSLYLFKVSWTTELTFLENLLSNLHSWLIPPTFCAMDQCFSSSLQSA